jgi:ankyrin repeat protein
MLKLMLDHFNNPEWEVDRGKVLKKALLTAITQSSENQLELVKLLVQSGASIQYEISGSLPSLPLEAAATKDLLPVVEYLLEVKDNQKQRVDLSAESGIHGTALRAAIAARSERVAQHLIIHQAEEFKIQQLPMAESSNLPTKTPKNEPRNVQFPAMWIAQATPGSAISAPAGSTGTRSAEEVENVRKQAEPISRDAEYGNILQLAASQRLKSTVELLLKYGADPNIQDTSNRRALHIASWFGFPEIVDLLLEYGADINAKDEWGETARDQAEESLNRDGHPGGSEADLQRIRQTFANRLVEINPEKPGTEFKGPKKIKSAKKSTRKAKSGKDEWGKEKPRSEETKVVPREVGIGATETTRTLAKDLSTVVELASTGTGPTSTEVKPENAVKVFPKTTRSKKAKPVFTMPSWVPGLGFRATIVDIWESEAETEVQECLLWKEPKVDEILYKEAIIDAIMKYDAKPTGAKEKVRWIHLPTNNVSFLQLSWPRRMH